MFIPHTEAETEQMLRAVGTKNIDDLFLDVPANLRFPKLNIPQALTEMEAAAYLQGLASANETTRDMACFLGAGAYNHYIPAAVDSLKRRGEFFTAYTPYQPEISQGTLQVIFEYQSLIAKLTGMQVCNASHYDGATAVAEAAVLAFHHFREQRSKIVVSSSVHPHYRATLRTYMQGYENMKVVGDDPGKDPLDDPNTLSDHLDTDTALLLISNPDFFGRINDFSNLIRKAHEVGALAAVVINPISLGMLKTPGEMDADIAVGEGQPLGIPLSLGGPYLGLFAAKKDLVRKMAGRLVGETVDKNGRRGYVLTLTAREQHIRREKATSNICTNQGLLALAATIYLSLIGKQGLRQVAELCYQKAHFTAARIAAIPGYQLCSEAPFFHEFAICCPRPVKEINAHLLDHGILGGYDLSREFPGMDDRMLVAVTEMNTRDDIEMFCGVLEEVSHA